MVYNIIDPFYEKVPAVVCTAGSYIAVENFALRQELGKSVTGEMLFSAMAPADVLKYDAHFASSSEAEIFSFTLSKSYGCRYATAVFERIMTRRIAVVFFSRTLDEAKDLKALLLSRKEGDPKRAADFAKSLLGIPDSRFDPSAKTGFIDIKKATYAAVKNVSRLQQFSDIDITVTENEEMKRAFYMPEDIPMSGYLQMIIQLLFAAGELSGDRRCEVKLCKYAMNAEVRVTFDAPSYAYAISGTDSLIDLCPRAGVHIALCEYTAGVFQSTLSVLSSYDMKKLTLALSIKENEFAAADFKSRDPQLYFEESFDFALKYTLLLASGNAEE